LILANHFQLPVHVPYASAGGLPFAYPPLSFYVQAALIGLFHHAPFLIVYWSPPLETALDVLTFYGLARQVSQNRLEVLELC
jgi:4-amino-4-deoxy-L-arabinose transferase-like glycosyltransferase